jgi:hypothetical protein
VAGAYEQFWTPLLSSLIGLIELPEDGSVPADEHFMEIEDTPWYQSVVYHRDQFAQLLFAGMKGRDPVAEIADPKQYLAQSLYRVNSFELRHLFSLAFKVS